MGTGSSSCSKSEPNVAVENTANPVTPPKPSQPEASKAKVAEEAKTVAAVVPPMPEAQPEASKVQVADETSTAAAVTPPMPEEQPEVSEAQVTEEAATAAVVAPPMTEAQPALSEKTYVEQLCEVQEALLGLIKEKNCNPILVRLAWHDSGTYNKEIAEWPNCGGANGSIRLAPEVNHFANRGLTIALGLLEPIAQKYPQISFADIIQMASAVSIQAAGGPKIPMRYGRMSVMSAEECVEEGRLPGVQPPFSDGSATPMQHLRRVFGRMGLSVADLVALSGAHTLGRMRPERYGGGEVTTAYTADGPGNPGGISWTKDWLTFDNSYFVILRDAAAGVELDPQLLVLASDKGLIEEEESKVLVLKYAEDQAAFFADYAISHQKLSELGVKWMEGGPFTL